MSNTESSTELSTQDTKAIAYSHLELEQQSATVIMDSLCIDKEEELDKIEKILIGEKIPPVVYNPVYAFLNSSDRTMYVELRGGGFIN
jgi:hypothetical protein